MLELSLVIIVGGVIFLGLYKVVKNQAEDNEFAEERAFTQAMNSGIQNSFLDIIEAYRTRASTALDGVANWGWTNSPNTSPFPISLTVGGLAYLDYRLDTIGIPANELANLRGEIASNFNGACSLDAPQPNGKVRLFCPKLVRISYNIGTLTNTANAHVLGQQINPINTPTVNVVYNRRNRDFPAGSAVPLLPQTYTFSMDEVYANRRNVSLRRLNTIRTAMEGFHNKTLMREIANRSLSSGAGGLNSINDEFVPWIWKALGDNPALANSLNCVKTVAGGACTNFASSDVWKTSGLSRSVFTNRIIKNLLGGDRSFAVDGFNNPIFIYMLNHQCPVGVANLILCPIGVIPATPSDNYINVGTPPYISVIFIPTANFRNVVYPDYARMYVSY